MGKIQSLSNETGVFFRVKIKTEVRPFDLVENACASRGWDAPKRPGYMEAVARAKNAINRQCASSVAFPAGSANAYWTERDSNGNKVTRTGDRNPCYSLKMERVKKLSVDGAEAFTVHIHDKRPAGDNCRVLLTEDDPHVLTVVFQSGYPVKYTAGDADAYAQFGADVEAIITAEHDKYYTNFDDNDVRALIYDKIRKLRGLEVFGATCVFFQKAPKVNATEEERAEWMAKIESLVEFIKEVKHPVSPFALATDVEMNRDSLMEELIGSIMAEFDAVEKKLDDDLAKVNPHRKRGDKRREQMHTATTKNINEVKALAEYHKLMLGCVAVQSIDERVSQMMDKARRLLEHAAAAPAPAATPEPAQTIEITAEPEGEILDGPPPADVVTSTDAADPFTALE